MRRLVQRKKLCLVCNELRWNAMLSEMANITSWRIAKERLHTRGPVCDNGQESEFYHFLESTIAASLWILIGKWWKSRLITKFNMLALLTFTGSTHEFENYKSSFA